MKKNKIIFILLIVLAGFLVIPACNQVDQPLPMVFESALPASPSPANEGVVPLGETTYTLKWEGTDADSQTKWDVYFTNDEGLIGDPSSLIQEGLTANELTVEITEGGTYYWQVVTTDGTVLTRSDIWSFQVNSDPTVPITPSPAIGATNVKVSPKLSWVCSDPQDDDLTYDIYLGTTDPPALAFSNVADATYTLATALPASTLHYWKVVAHDPYGGMSEGPVWSFTTGLEAVMTYTGNYNCDEPAEAYSYDVTFAKVSSTSVKTVNYWNSGWTGTFTLDFAKLTYSMPVTQFTAVWSAVESGIIDPSGDMVGTYTIWQNGVAVEQGVHTYTKQ